MVSYRLIHRFVGEGMMAIRAKQANFTKVLQESFGAWKDGRHPELAKGTRLFVRSLRKSARLKRLRER